MSCLDRLDGQITSLRNLEPGWLDGEGEAIHPTAIAWASDVREACARGEIKRSLRLYPTPGGGVRLEFDRGPFAVSAEFYPKSQTVDFDTTRVRGLATSDISETIETMAQLVELIQRVGQLSVDTFWSAK